MKALGALSPHERQPRVPSEKLTATAPSPLREPAAVCRERGLATTAHLGGDLRVASLCLSLSPAQVRPCLLIQSGGAVSDLQNRELRAPGWPGLPVLSPGLSVRDTGHAVPVSDLAWGGILLGLGMPSGSRTYFTGGFLSHPHRKLGTCTEASGPDCPYTGRSFSRGCEPPATCAWLRACVPAGG